MKDSERVQPITRLFIELAAVELLSDKPNSDQKVLYNFKSSCRY
jgi:hypothetical protein